MPGKDMKMIGKTLHEDGYYTASILTSEDSESAAAAATSEATTTLPKIKLWFRFDKGLIIGLEQREKLIREDHQLAAKEEIPTPGFVLLPDEEAKTTTTVTNSHADSTFQSKLDATKRKMQYSYQQLANAKKQRRIQVIDPPDLSPPTTQPSSKGKGTANVAARKKKMITTNKKRRNFFDGGSGRPSKLMKPTSIF